MDARAASSGSRAAEATNAAIGNVVTVRFKIPICQVRIALPYTHPSDFLLTALSPIPSDAPTNAGLRNVVPQDPASNTPVQLSPALVKDLENANSILNSKVSTTTYPTSLETGHVQQAYQNTVQHPSTKRKRNKITTADHFATTSGPVFSTSNYPPTRTGHAGLGISVPSSTPVQQSGNSTIRTPQPSDNILLSSHMAWNTDDHQSADAGRATISLL